MNVFEETFVFADGKFLLKANKALAFCERRFGAIDHEEFSTGSDQQELYAEIGEKFDFAPENYRYAMKWSHEKFEIWEVRYYVQKALNKFVRNGASTVNVDMQKLFVVIHDPIVALQYGLKEELWKL